MKPIAIYGAGSLGREILVLLCQINDIYPTWDITGFYDDNGHEPVHGLPVLGDTDTLNDLENELNIVVAVGNPYIRKKIINRISNPLIKYPVILHPSVQAAPYQHIEIGEGTIVAANSVLTVDINIGRHVLLNIGCMVGHDVVIEDFASVMPGVMIFGPTRLGEGCFVGAGAAIMNRVEIAPRARVATREVVSMQIPKILE